MPITNYYVASDAMGSATAILDEEGNVLERRTYDAFGEVACILPDGTPVAESPTGLDVGFQGQIRDDVSGLYQMGYRCYNTLLGRWLSSDPIGLNGGASLNVFVNNSPLINSDVYGLWKDGQRKGGAWATVCAEKCDTWEGLAARLGLSPREANLWVRGFEQRPTAGKCYEVPNTIFIYNSETRKTDFSTPITAVVTFLQDFKFSITPHYRDQLRNSAKEFSRLGFKVVMKDNASSSTDFKNGWSSEGIYEVYFAGHGEESRGGFITEPNNPDADAVDGGHVCPPYKLHAVFALSCYSNKNSAWRGHVAPEGVFLGFEELSTLFNREPNIPKRLRFEPGRGTR